MVKPLQMSKRVEKLLQGVEEKVRVLLDVPTDAIVLLDKTGAIQDLNGTAVRRFGRNSMEMRGRLIWDFLPPDLVESGKRHLRYVAETGKPFRFEYQREGRWDDTVIFPIPDKDGDSGFFGVAARDITERKQVEERLQKSQSLSQKIVDGISDPLILLDQEDRVQIINKAAQEYFGMPDTHAALGKLCFNGLRGRITPCEGCHFPFPGNERVGRFERKGLIDPDKVEQVVVYSTFDDLGRREATIIRISDVTDNKIMEKQLIRSEKLASLGLLVSAMAHEMNNPSAFISLNIPILRDYIESLLPLADNYFESHPDFEPCGLPYLEFKADILKLMDNMEHGSNRIGKIITSLKHYTKESAQTVACSDVKTALQRALEFCQPKLRKKIHSLEVHIPDDLPSVLIDPEALEQVLVNLIINAVQASDKEDSWLRTQAFLTKEPTPRCTITVSDNGAGIDDKNKDRVFDPFFSTKGPSEGTGLGLYVCHNLVNSAGGSIEFESRLGEGSTFRVVLGTLDTCSAN